MTEFTIECPNGAVIKARATQNDEWEIIEPLSFYQIEGIFSFSKSYDRASTLIERLGKTVSDAYLKKKGEDDANKHLAS